MIVRICSFTSNGSRIVNKLEDKLPKILFEKKNEYEDLDKWVSDGFSYKAPIVFVGAVGIAVRKIAPFVNDKTVDSPIIVIDEGGKFVIPLLSGHIGGANEISHELAKAIEASPVITTATDVNNLFAIDVFAVKNGLEIVNRQGIKAVSGKLIKEGFITMAIDPVIEYEKNDVLDYIKIVPYEEGRDGYADVIIDTKETTENLQSLHLFFKPYVLGIGCKKDTQYEKLESYLQKILDDNKIHLKEIAFMGTIDLKARERGLLYLEAAKRIPLFTYSAEELHRVKGEFSRSQFVESVTGVSNVCERAAMKLAGDRGLLIIPKSPMDGMTIAIAQRQERMMIWKN